MRDHGRQLAHIPTKPRFTQIKSWQPMSQRTQVLKHEFAPDTPSSNFTHFGESPICFDDLPLKSGDFSWLCQAIRGYTSHTNPTIRLI